MLLVLIVEKDKRSAAEDEEENRVGECGTPQAVLETDWGVSAGMMLFGMTWKALKSI
jgi:hypothetical protein